MDSMSVILAPFLIIITSLAIPALVIFLIGAVMQAFCVIWAPYARICMLPPRARERLESC